MSASVAQMDADAPSPTSFFEVYKSLAPKLNKLVFNYTNSLIRGMLEQYADKTLADDIVASMKWECNYFSNKGIGYDVAQNLHNGLTVIDEAMVAITRDDNVLLPLVEDLPADLSTVSQDARDTIVAAAATYDIFKNKQSMSSFVFRRVVNKIRARKTSTPSPKAAATVTEAEQKAADANPSGFTKKLFSTTVANQKKATASAAAKSTSAELDKIIEDSSSDPTVKALSAIAKRLEKLELSHSTPTTTTTTTSTTGQRQRSRSRSQGPPTRHQQQRRRGPRTTNKTDGAPNSRGRRNQRRGSSPSPQAVPFAAALHDKKTTFNYGGVVWSQKKIIDLNGNHTVRYQDAGDTDAPDTVFTAEALSAMKTSRSKQQQRRRPTQSKN